jgi:hypothetical protein
MLRSFMMPILLLPMLACAQAKVAESNKKWANGLVVAANMCAGDRSVQHTKDIEGQRVYCGFEELVGSHVPKCVCRDEMQAPDERADAQEYIRQAAQQAYQPGSSTSAINSGH